mmetsp:Transcript_75830/g.138195  ORF Transcript_75830/g.138195 Transcript_75830/m.138195 type:complete len:272 (+) Transcript_75830:102-917(+)
MPRVARDEIQHYKWEIDPRSQKWEVHGSGWSSLFNSKSRRLPGAKGWHPEELGPGKYLGHETYEHTQLVGPFLAKRERFFSQNATVGETVDTVAKRGPGLYIGHVGWDEGVKPGVAPFGHNAERMHTLKTNCTKMYEKLGPGTYLGHVEYKVPSSPVGFGSSSNRFAPPPRAVKHTGELGPGKYVGHQDWTVKPMPVGFGEAQERFKQPRAVSTKMYPDMGPGRYLGHTSYNVPENKEAFQSSSSRFSDNSKPPTAADLGPGSYLGHKSYG